jgi:hypothetical protein
LFEAKSRRKQNVLEEFFRSSRDTNFFVENETSISGLQKWIEIFRILRAIKIVIPGFTGYSTAVKLV